MLTAAVREDTRTGPAGKMISLRIRDTGEGMRDEVRARIFEPYTEYAKLPE